MLKCVYQINRIAVFYNEVIVEILCKKLNAIGIRNIDWFNSYLSNRKQFVQLETSMSKPGTVKCGGRQGSMLGPLLFLIYVNDMASSIDPECKLILYADDSAILFSHKNPDCISKKLGDVLKQC